MNSPNPIPSSRQITPCYGIYPPHSSFWRSQNLRIFLRKCPHTLRSLAITLNSKLKNFKLSNKLSTKPALLFLLTASALAFPNKPARPTDPILSLPLADLGFEPIQPRYAVSGATMFTLHFVDESHLLLTFNAKGLIPRLPDALPGDDDRLITALLLEAPTGKVLARTQWRTRDREQYLWPLAHGRFLLRIRTRLTIIDPVAGLVHGDAFKEATFLDMHRRIGYVSVSPGGDMLVIETVPPRKQQEEDAAAVAAALAAYRAAAPPGSPQLSNPSAPKDQPAFEAKPSNSNFVEIHFFRLAIKDEPGQSERLVARAAGRLNSESLVHIPLTSEGFVDISQESRHTWLFDFQGHDGKRRELSPFDTTCAPRPYFVSRSEFVSFGCDENSRVEFSGFDLRAQEPWIQVLSGTQIGFHLASAPTAGRFVFSRILAAESFYSLENLTPDEIASQDIAVIQTWDGRTVFKTQASPIQRAGQNFDISPDGLSFTVIRNSRLELYRLPALTARDQADLKASAASVPAASEAIVRLHPAKPNESVPSNTADVVAESVEPVPTAAPAEPGKSAPSSSPADPSLTDAPRPRPSLYGPDYPKPPKQ